MKVLASGLKGANAIKQAQGSCRKISKVMKLGTNYRLFFPLETYENGERDVRIAAVPGRNLNYDKLGVSFLRLDDFDQSETGKITDLTGMAAYARIARIFHNAECEAMKEEAKEAAQKEAAALGRSEIDTVALAAKLREIDQTYNGDRKAKPQPIYATENPMIGGIVIKVATECLVVPLDANGAPVWEEATPAAVDISNQKAAKFIELINNKDYCPEGAEFLEVGWSWIGTDAKEAGRNATYQGISHETALATKFPQSWEANKDALKRISTTSEAIAAKNQTMSSKATPKEVQQLFCKYLNGHKLIMTKIDLEDDMTKNAAQDILDFGLVSDIPTIQGKLLAIVNAGKEAAPEEGTAAEALDKVQMEQISGAETLGQLTQATSDIDNLTGGEDIEAL